jgi:hypothetical protein
MKKIKIILLVAVIGGAVWVLSGRVSLSSEKVVPKALWNAVGISQTDSTLDSDNDGLTDVEEAKWRTDPKKADTDGDGFLDGQEVHDGYDPLRAAPGDRLTANTNHNSNSNTNTNSQANDNSGIVINSSVPASNSNVNSNNNGSAQNVTEQVALKVDDLISRYKIYSTPYQNLDDATKTEVEKELNGFSAQIIKNTGLDFAFNIPEETLRLNGEEPQNKDQYVGRAKDILRQHNLIADNQTIEDGIHSIFADLTSMGKTDIDWDKVNNWKKETPTCYQDLLEMPVNPSLKPAHIRLLRVVKSLDIVFQNINEGDYFRAFLAAGRADKIGGELDKFTQELK